VDQASGTVDGVIRAAAVGALAAVVSFGLIAAVAGIEDEGAGGSRAVTAAAEPAATRAEIASGRELFARMACGSCHSLAAAGARGRIGPDLSGVLGRHTRESLVATIRNPPSNGDFNAMPRDFGSRMTAEELDALAAFLIAARDG
jgi:mono/diheme cytochrome c family protein